MAEKMLNSNMDEKKKMYMTDEKQNHAKKLSKHTKRYGKKALFIEVRS